LKQVIVPSACTRFLGFIREVLVDQGGLGFGLGRVDGGLGFVRECCDGGLGFVRECCDGGLGFVREC
jgi:hypothetical protein